MRLSASQPIVDKFPTIRPASGSVPSSFEQVGPLSRVWSIGSSMADSMLTNTCVTPSGAVGFEDPLFKRAESSTPTYTIAFSCEVLPPPENGQLPGGDDAGAANSGSKADRLFPGVPHRSLDGPRAARSVARPRAADYLRYAGVVLGTIFPTSLEAPGAVVTTVADVRLLSYGKAPRRAPAVDAGAGCR
jgi:hypothetical protein